MLPQAHRAAEGREAQLAGVGPREKPRNDQSHQRRDSAGRRDRGAVVPATDFSARHHRDRGGPRVRRVCRHRRESRRARVAARRQYCGCARLRGVRSPGHARRRGGRGCDPRDSQRSRSPPRPRNWRVAALCSRRRSPHSRRSTSGCLSGCLRPHAGCLAGKPRCC